MSDDDNNPEIKEIPIRDIRPGPIRHESLTPSQLERARVIYKCLEPFLKMPFEKFELNFLRDMHPEQEIQIWSCIAVSHQQFLQQNPAVSFEDAERAYKAFLMISMGAERPADIDESQWRNFEEIYEGRDS